MAIRSFADRATQEFFLTGVVKGNVGWASVKAIARRKLDLLQYALDLRDLRSPPGNRLEALSGKLKGQHSIRVNDQWRVIFRWTAAGPYDVKVADYH